jgi:hypothetical protein
MSETLKQSLGVPAHEKALLRGAVQPYESGQSLALWYPMTINTSGEQPLLAWRYLGGRALSAAFFEDNFASQSVEDRRVCYTPLAALAQFDADQDQAVRSLAPSAFVFHVSRCGSTLITQTLSQLSQCVALSEPPVLDAFFRLHHQRPDLSGGVAVFRQLLAALGQARRADEQRLIVKLDSWHVPWMPWVHQAFPQIPIIFLYREPQQVLASHRRQRGLHMVPGLLPLAPLQIAPSPALQPGDLDGYAQHVLTAIVQTALTHAEMPGLHLLNYSQLPQAIWEDLMPMMSLRCDADTLLALQARTHFHAKHGHARFMGDAPVSPSINTPPDETLWQCYAALEKKRLEISPAA